jgi:type I restriction enzyme, S subunit
MGARRLDFRQMFFPKGRKITKPAGLWRHIKAVLTPFFFNKNNQTEQMNEEQNINQLPKDWKWVKLGEVCEKVEAVKRKEKNPEEELLYLDIGGIDNSANKILSHKNYKWKDAPSRAQQIVFKDDVLFSTVRTYMKNIAVVENKIYDGQIASSGFCVIRSDKKVTNPKFIFYYTVSQNFLRPLNELQTGSSYPAVRDKDVFIQPFPLPPKPTQQAIVSKIEELFSELDKGIKNLRTVQLQLKTYRQSVLKWAFEGKLTNENVEEGELPEGWKQVQIKDVAETYGGYAFKSGEFKGEGKYQVLRMGNVRPGVLRYDESPVFLDSVDENILSRSLLQINDVIITQTGTRKKRDYGFTVLIPKSNLLLNQRIAAIRFKEKYLPKLFLYFSWTDLFKDQFFANETGNVGQGNVGMKAVTETLIPFCSIDEQNNIVQEIESRLSVADKMEESIAQSLQQAEALRQSILKKAFEGRLV